MASVEDLVMRMRANPTGVRFSDLKKVCTHFFGAPRQNAKGKAKPYQVRQALAAIDRLTDEQVKEGDK